jgi:hypothetical protein
MEAFIGFHAGWRQWIFAGGRVPIFVEGNSPHPLTAPTGPQTGIDERRNYSDEDYSPARP